MSQIDTTNPSQYGFPAGSIIYECDRRAQHAIIEARLRLRGPECFMRFWDIVLTPQERDQLGGDVEVCYERNRFPANHLAPLRGWSAEHAIVEIAYRIGLLTQLNYEWLLREIGVEFDQPQPGTPPESFEVPSWDRGTGRLELGGELCRAINVRAATRIVPILEEFQSQNWPVSIESPVDTSVDRQRIHDAVKNLNHSMNQIRFGVQGNSICWIKT